MTTIFWILAVLHFVGWAIVLGGYLTSMRQPALPKGVLHGALTALVAGLGMMAILGGDANHAKLAVKLGITVVICALAWLGQRQGDKLSPLVRHSLGLLTAVNVVVAVVW